MLLSRFEFHLMNNPVRAAVQRYFEVPTLARMGGVLGGARVLEVGCGRGYGIQLLLDHLGAGQVDAFDLDPEMVALARRRLAARADRVQIWVGDAARIQAANDCYDAVVDFGIIHHVPSWQEALVEIHRVLRPGGRLYAEEIYEPFIVHPVLRRLFRHPEQNRFGHDRFNAGLRQAGFGIVSSDDWFGLFGFHIADKQRQR